jgi:hypothetical protein
MIRKFLTTTAVALAATGAILAGASGATAAAVPAGAAPAPAACTAATIIQVGSFAFHPSAVAPGASSAAVLTSTNCTAETQATTQTWFGQFLSATGTGIPAGCAAIDPYNRAITYGPNQSVTDSTSYLVLSTCTANALKVTVKITNSAGVQLAQASATLTIEQ